MCMEMTGRSDIRVVLQHCSRDGGTSGSSAHCGSLIVGLAAAASAIALILLWRSQSAYPRNRTGLCAVGLFDTALAER